MLSIGLIQSFILKIILKSWFRWIDKTEKMCKIRQSWIICFALLFKLFFKKLVRVCRRLLFKYDYLADKRLQTI